MASPVDELPETNSPRQTCARGESGFALVLVLWVMALLALSATLLASATNGFVEITRNDAARTQATLLADAGIRIAMHELLRPDVPGAILRFRPGAGATRCRLPDGEAVQIRIEDEAGKVDLNVASDQLLRALFRGLGVDNDRAEALADAIADYRDGDDEKRLNGAEAPEYAAAGRAGPKNAVLDSIVELGAVLGVSPDLFRRARPFLTVHSGLAGVDPHFAAPALAELLAVGGGNANTSTGTSRATNASVTADAGTIPAEFVATSTRRAFTILAEVISASGLRITRRALVTRVDGSALAARRLASDEPLAENAGRRRPREGAPAASLAFGLQVHEWDTAGPEAPASDDPANLPQC